MESAKAAVQSLFAKATSEDTTTDSSEHTADATKNVDADEVASGPQTDASADAIAVTAKGTGDDAQ
jgi:hypothetical protein